MTAAGTATVAFITIIAALYITWTALSWRHWCRTGDASFLELWAWFHAVAAVFAVVLLLVWLSTVAGWSS